MSRSALVFVVLIVSALFRCANAERILVVAPFFGASHAKFTQIIALHMASRGHDMTVITFHVVKDPPANYRQIQVDRCPVLDQQDFIVFGHRRNISIYEQINIMWHFPPQSTISTLNTPAVQRLIDDPRERFDLVVCEEFYHEALYMFADRFDAPLALLSSSTHSRHTLELMGAPMPLTYALSEMYKDDEDSALATVYNAIACTYESVYRRWWHLPAMSALAREHFGHREAEDMPTIGEVELRASIVLINTHFSFDRVVPLVPGVIEIGGAHLKQSQPLPEDLREFLDGAVDGAIVFALGSHLNISQMTADRIESFALAFAGLRQKVIWKWEDDEPPPAPAKNVIYRKWIPQFDALGHPNVKLFIGHGGMLSIQEAVHHAVPMIGIPLFADQYRNVRQLVRKGVGVLLDYNKINPSNVQNSLERILHDDGYSQRMKRVSAMFKDRVASPLDTAAYWLEWTIRHGDPAALKSPLAYMSLLQYYHIEIFAFVICFLIVYILSRAILIVIWTFRWMRRIYRGFKRILERIGLINTKYARRMKYKRR